MCWVKFLLELRCNWDQRGDGSTESFTMHQFGFTTSSRFISNSQTVSASYLPSCSEELGKRFWQQWQQYQGYLHRCCIKWMGGNSFDAEDALSRVMLKAWEKVQKYAGEIANFKSWLTSLAHNLCMDIHRERSRGSNRVENIDDYVEEQELISSEDTPLYTVETDEKQVVIRRAIDKLDDRLRETFILHFYHELSYPEIAQQQEISYQNVCKRISQARKILQEELRGYFIGETDTQLSVSRTATQSPIGEMSQENETVEAGASQTLTLSVAVEEPQEVVESEQHSESMMVAVTNEEKLEVNKDSSRCVEAVLCILQLAPILANGQCRILPAVGMSKLHSQTWEILELYRRRWQVWMDSGGYWLCSILNLNE